MAAFFMFSALAGESGIGYLSHELIDPRRRQKLHQGYQAHGVRVPGRILLPPKKQGCVPR
jgi:hypothetical protein